MSTCLIVDAACDLPESILSKYKVKVIPVGIKVGDSVIYDKKDTQQMETFYVTKALERGEDVDTCVPEDELINNVYSAVEQQGYDYGLGQIITRRRSKTFEAVDGVAKARHDTTKTSYGVIDSKTLFAGQGALAAYSLALMNKGVSGTKLRRATEAMSKNVSAFCVIRDPAYLRERARRKGDNTTGAFTALLGKALNICPIAMFEDGESYVVAKKSGFAKSVNLLCANLIPQIEKQLLSPFVVISYAGNVSEIENFDGVKKLKAVVEAKKGKVLPCVMSLAGGVNLGPGSLAVGACLNKFDFDESIKP